MKVAHCEKYGSADVVEIREVARPAIGDNEVLVQVHATSVTTADWRIRASAFPGVFWLAGRLMFGLLAPRNGILGSDFAGRIVATGTKATKFKEGDAVFGFSENGGAHGEYLVAREFLLIWLHAGLWTRSLR